MTKKMLKTPTVKALTLEAEYQKGRRDRAEGRPCLSTRGAYLNGWYGVGTEPYYYITKEHAHLLPVAKKEN